MAIEKKEPNYSLWQTVSSELAQAEVIHKKISEKWEKLSLKKEEIEIVSQEILERWNNTHAEILKGENSVADAEECMGIGPAVEGEAEVPDVTGASMQMAKSKIKRAGFKPVFKGGNPAPIEKQAFTVASQKPEAGEVLEKGQSVNLILYGMFAGNKIPDVVGLSSKEAKEKIEKAGFKVILAGGDPAPSEKVKFKVQSQEPEAGEIAEPDTPVKIRIYGDIHYVNVPSLVSKTSSQAKSAVSGAGLVPNLIGGISAPKSSLSYRVEAQAPAPGTKVLHGSPVSILVYGKFNEIAALENAHCNNLAGSILKWDYQEERAICACPSRMVINKAGNACIEDPRIQKQRDQRNQFWSAVIQTAVPIIIKEITKDDKPSGGNRSGGNSSGGNRSGGNTSGGTSSSSGGSRSTTGNTGLTGGDPNDCELKFCPECNEADKGLDLMGVAISPQCRDCRIREKTNIDKCIRGEKTGRGTKSAKKDYMVVCVEVWNEYLKKNECRYEMGKIGGNVKGNYTVDYRGTWARCVDRLNELGVGTTGDPSSF
jgi:beta-lactam-binding protein with PASTA domain